MNSGLVALSDVRKALLDVGLGESRSVILHASMKSFGLLEAGADQLLESVRTVLGEEGVIMMPSFTYSFSGRVGASPFNPVTSESQVGWVSNRLRTMPGSVRSHHPTHSVTAIGPGCKDLIKGHEKIPALGKGSPMDQMQEKGCDVLMAGVGFSTLSLIHVAEALANVPYLEAFCWEHQGWRPEGMVQGEDGTTKLVPLRQVPGCSQGFPALYPVCLSQGLLRQTSAGPCLITCVRGQDVVESAMAMLAEDAFCLLCGPGRCPACDERRRKTNAKSFNA